MIVRILLALGRTLAGGRRPRGPEVSREAVGSIS
jgi:hypothetical protein